MSEDPALVVRHTSGVMRQLEDARREAVGELRGRGESWHSIGLLMGMTGEGVRRRYGR